MAVYYLKNTDWVEITNFWENELSEKFKDDTVFQMEPFPSDGPKDITFISYVPEVVQLVEQKFGLEVNKYWTSVGSRGTKRLTGDNSEWNDIPLYDVED